MTDRGEPIETAIGIVQSSTTGRWHLWLEYEDGEELYSRESFATEDEATQAALRWGLANAVPDKMQ